MIKKGTNVACALLREKIRAGYEKIRKSVFKGVACHQDNLFWNNQSQLYREFRQIAKSDDENTQYTKEVKGFWGKIWSVYKKHENGVSWLWDVSGRCGAVEHIEGIVVCLEDGKTGRRKMVQEIPISTFTNDRCFARFQGCWESSELVGEGTHVFCCFLLPSPP